MRPSVPTLTMMSPNSDGIGQPALHIQRVLKGRALLGQRRSADDPCSYLDVLLFDCVDDVARGHASYRELVGIEPQAHRIVAYAEDRDVADSRQPGDLILQFQRDVVTEEQRVVRSVGRIERDRQGDVGRRLLDRDTQLLNFCGKLRQRDGHAVLHLHLGHVEIRPDLEGYRQAQGAVVGRLARHVEHVLHAVDLLFDRRGDGFRYGLGVGARIG